MVWVGNDHRQEHLPLALVAPSPVQLGLMDYPSLVPLSAGPEGEGIILNHGMVWVGNPIMDRDTFPKPRLLQLGFMDYPAPFHPCPLPPGVWKSLGAGQAQGECGNNPEGGITPSSLLLTARPGPTTSK